MRMAFDRRTVLAALGGAVIAGCQGGRQRVAPPTSRAGPAPGASAAAALADRFDVAARCEVSTEQVEGPYYIDTDALRSDIRDDRQGAELRVGIRVLDHLCQPVPDAVVEVWHCDAGGLYSAFEAASRASRGAPLEGPPGPGPARYLRGAQVTTGEGIVAFTTVYPGWYPGRTPHIHAKVRLGRREALTTQLYFDDAVSDEVFRQQPYAAQAGRDRRNRADAYFDDRLVLTMAQEGAARLGLITLALA